LQGWVLLLFQFPMPQRLRRHHGQKHLHFLTFCCYHRRPYLETVRARNLFVKVLGEVRAKFEFLLVGYVVMPDQTPPTSS
jgi:putative transposase